MAGGAAGAVAAAVSTPLDVVKTLYVLILLFYHRISPLSVDLVALTALASFSSLPSPLFLASSAPTQSLLPNLPPSFLPPNLKPGCKPEVPRVMPRSAKRLASSKPAGSSGNGTATKAS
jgi:hypothetical protein